MAGVRADAAILVIGRFLEGRIGGRFDDCTGRFFDGCVGRFLNDCAGGTTLAGRRTPEVTMARSGELLADCDLIAVPCVRSTPSAVRRCVCALAGRSSV